MSDPQKYRTKEEVETYKSKDSIDRLAAFLMGSPVETVGQSNLEARRARSCLTEEKFLAMQAEIKEIVRDAVEFAEQSPAPEVEAELYSDVLVNPQANMSPSGDYTVGAKNPLL
jgi:pyruvate dehydrogenase E1 component alpha subunit